MKVKEIRSEAFLGFLQYNQYEDLEESMWVLEDLDDGDLIVFNDPSGNRSTYEVVVSLEGLIMIDKIVSD